MAYIVMAYTAMAYTVMAHIDMAYIVMAYIVLHASTSFRAAPDPPVESEKMHLSESEAFRHLLDDVSALRNGRFAADRNNLSTEEWSRGLWGTVAVPEHLLSGFPSVVPFPRSLSAGKQKKNPCATKCGPAGNPMIYSRNTRSGNEIVVNETCVADGLIEVKYCQFPAHPEVLPASTWRYNLEKGIPHTDHPRSDAQDASGCPEGAFGWVPGGVVPAEAVRIISVSNLKGDSEHSQSRSVDGGTQSFSTLLGCIARADLELEREGKKENCKSVPANVDIIVLDTTSRISFYLQATQTTQWLEEYGSTPHQQDHLIFDFPRFNKVRMRDRSLCECMRVCGLAGVRKPRSLAHGTCMCMHSW